jgi:hypothetical protein
MHVGDTSNIVPETISDLPVEESKISGTFAYPYWKSEDNERDIKAHEHENRPVIEQGNDTLLRSSRKRDPPILYGRDEHIASFKTSVNNSSLTLEVDNIDVEELLKSTRRTEGLEAIKKEFEVLKRSNVWIELTDKDLASLCEGNGKDRGRLLASDLKGALPLLLILNEKYDAEGKFMKMKARICVGGHRQSKDTYGEIYSPTVILATVMLVINLAAIKELVINVFDIVGAYLYTKVPADELILVFMNDHMYKIYKEAMREEYDKEKVSKKTYFKLNAYLYGLHQSALKFYELLSSCILHMGFRASSLDPCLFIKDEGGIKSFIVLYVDDILTAFPSEKAAHEFKMNLQQQFEITVQSKTINFLKMAIEQTLDKGTIKVTQQGLVDKLIQKYLPGQHASKATPVWISSHVDVHRSHLSLSATSCDRNLFLSIVMSLMYLARYTRPDILFSVTYLATKCSNPTELDMKGAIRILKYLKGTKYRGLLFQKTDPILRVWVDASHGLHADGRGHGGLVATLGSSPIMWKSWKLKHVTLSSTESELSSLSESATWVVWLRGMMNALGVQQLLPTTVYQDNKSCIIMTIQGYGNFSKTKHMLVRKSFVKELIDDKTLILEYLPTEEMVADILTKHLTKIAFQSAVKLLRLYTSDN